MLITDFCNGLDIGLMLGGECRSQEVAEFPGPCSNTSDADPGYINQALRRIVFTLALAI